MSRATPPTAPKKRLPIACTLMLITDGAGDATRIAAIVEAAVAGGVRSVQVREPRFGACQLLELCGRLRSVLEAVGGLLLVNDRVDVHPSINPDICQELKHTNTRTPEPCAAYNDDATNQAYRACSHPAAHHDRLRTAG